MNRKIGIVGLGYVGLPVAVAFGSKHSVVGFDINESRISSLINGIDYTKEVTDNELESASIKFTSDASQLKETDFIIVAVPTPINEHNQPDLTPLVKASETVGKNISKGTIIVFESTVYPGATEEVCVPILEEFSGLRCGEDFFVGYSPERINPGDKIHTFTTITKVVSGQTPEVLDVVADTYSSVVKAGVHKASSIKVAEAAKVIENTQRDVNIALMNELALIFDRLDIDTTEVLAAAGTKWNFLKFYPGLVGGHCIGVDPYYLTHKAQALGYQPDVILAGRRINDSLGQYIARTVVKKLIKQGISVQGATVTILGLTFKENVPDLRNSKIIDVIRELMEFDVKVQVSDSRADHIEAMNYYGISLVPYENLTPADALVFAVAHKEYTEKSWGDFEKLIKKDKGVFVDLKGILPLSECPKHIISWRL